MNSNELNFPTKIIQSKLSNLFFRLINLDDYKTLILFLTTTLVPKGNFYVSSKLREQIHPKTFFFYCNFKTATVTLAVLLEISNEIVLLVTDKWGSSFTKAECFKKICSNTTSKKEFIQGSNDTTRISAAKQ